MKAPIWAFFILLGGILMGCSTIKSPSNQIRVAPPKPLTTQRQETFDIKILREFNQSERELAIQALKMVSSIDGSQIYPYLPQQLYWADMPLFYGLTITQDAIPFYTNKIILLDFRQTRPKETNDVHQMLFFGAILSHELHHYFHNSIDPDTKNKTDAEIYKRTQQNPQLLNNLLSNSKK